MGINYRFSNPIRYIPDHHVSISHEHSFMRITDGQGYIDGNLYDELYAEYIKLKSKKNVFFKDIYMKLITKSKISSTTFKKRIDVLAKIIDDAGLTYARYVSSSISEKEFETKRKQIAIEAYNLLFKDKIYEA